jgi:glycosyltransferase involved in cell wall biosynthesis
VGLVSQWYDPERGSAAQSGVIARSMVELGHEVDVVTGFPNYPTGRIYDGYQLRPYQRDDMGEVRVHRGLLYPSHDANPVRRSLNYVSFALGAAGVALRQLRGVDVCLVHATPATAALPAMVLERLRGVPYVVHVHDLWPDSVLSSGFLRGWQSRLAARVLHAYCDAMYRRAGAVAVTSPGMAAKIQARGVRAEKIHFVPNWADEEVFRPTPADPTLRAVLGLSAPLTVMYAGNLGEYQDLHTVIEAAGILRDRDDIEFIFVGEGVERGSLQDRSAALRLRNVRFVGARPFAEMPSLLAIGDLQLVTLRDLDIFTTTLPSKLVATLASGRPVLGSLTGDAASLVRESGAGEVVPPGDPGALAAAVLRFHGLEEDERVRQGAAGRSYYHHHLGRSAVATRLSELLDRVAGEARRSEQ